MDRQRTLMRLELKAESEVGNPSLECRCGLRNAHVYSVNATDVLSWIAPGDAESVHGLTMG